mgnify:CR=1 FL=1
MSCNDYDQGFYDDGIYDFAGLVNILVPTGDLEVNNWTNSPLYSGIDEINYNDSDYKISKRTASTPFEIKLSGINYRPFFASGCDDHILRYRLGKSDESTGIVHANLELFNGDKLIKQVTHKNLLSGFNFFPIFLTKPEYNNITGFDNLSIRVSHSHNNMFENMINYWDFQNSGIDLYGKSDLLGTLNFIATQDGSGLSGNNQTYFTKNLYIPNSPQSGFTLITRVQAGALTSEHINFLSKSGIAGNYFRIISNPTNQQFIFTGSFNGVNHSISKAVTFTNNHQYFLAVICDPGSGNLSIYVDNTGISGILTNLFIDDFKPLIFNEFTSGSNVVWDDTILYQRPLKSGEILTLFNNGVSLNWSEIDSV